MPMSAIKIYMEQLRKQQAQFRIILGEAALLPHMDEDGRSNWHREMNEIFQIEKKPAQSIAMLRSIGIGVYKEK